jgi:sterol desaturase/sphingolipid hydroxylase (fatty acid hydroxylase superfamily)
MKKNYVSNSSESVRMFKSDLLEFFSKVYFFVPLIIYVPVIIYMVYKALFVASLGFLTFASLLLAGIFVWTFVEYIMHRFVFHYVPKAKWAYRLHFIFHGVHHDYPNDLKRLVLPPSASIPLALGFFLLYSLLLPASYVLAFFPGFIGGYLVYDMTHYAIHHFNFKSGIWKKIKQHHMLHHYSDPSKGYGVSSDFWDNIFRSHFTNK